MNIDDVTKESIELPKGSFFSALFKHQHELAVRYEPIELRNGFWHPGKRMPHIDEAKFQAWLKDYFWRTTEELAEAYECLDLMCDGELVDWRSQWEKSSNLRHFFEELADSLHFILEASIYAGLTPDAIDAIWAKAKACLIEPIRDPHVSLMMQSIIMRMGLAANCLKNKPWKETQMATDAERFKEKLLGVWGPIAQMWLYLGCSIEDVYVLYMRKNVVNHFRQNSKY